jgi:hypothetical protein
MLTDIELELKKKLGDKGFKRAQLLSHNKFGYKTHLIEKYYKSFLDGYLHIETEWADDYVIEMIKNKVDKSQNKIELIQEIIDTYDLRDDKTRHILDKYLRALKNKKI